MQMPARCANKAEDPVPMKTEIFGLKAPCKGGYMIFVTLVSKIRMTLILVPTSDGVKYFLPSQMKSFWDGDVPEEA